MTPETRAAWIADTYRWERLAERSKRTSRRIIGPSPHDLAWYDAWMDRIIAQCRASRAAIEAGIGPGLSSHPGAAGPTEDQ